MYKLKFAKRTQKQLETLKKNVKLHKKFLEILKDILDNPHSKAYNFKRLSITNEGLTCSKRLSYTDRIWYCINKVSQLIEVQDIEILSILGHYNDN
jgi:Txe/YoeB family toxin of Txe-Axe toxin-antitoxin module